jgi:Rrf2 family protein
LESESHVRLSARVEYAAIAVLGIACHGHRRGPISLREICEEQGVPSGFLVHILLQMKRAGIVKSTRGADGGYCLAKPAEEVTLHDIYCAIEGPAECPATVTAGFAGKSRGAAVLQDAWDAAFRAQAESLASLTLADLVSMSRSVTQPMYYI